MRVVLLAIWMLAFSIATMLVWPDAWAKGINALEYYVNASGKQMTKLEAGRSLMLNKGEAVWRCYQVQMSDKLTVVRKKK